MLNDYTKKDLTRELNRKSMSKSIEAKFTQHGEDAYHFILESIKKDELNKNQIVQGLFILFSISRMYPHLYQGLFDTLLDTAVSQDEWIRTYSVILILRIVDLSGSFPHVVSLERRNYEDVVQKSYGLGLHKSNRENIAGTYHQLTRKDIAGNSYEI